MNKLYIVAPTPAHFIRGCWDMGINYRSRDVVYVREYARVAGLHRDTVIYETGFPSWDGNGMIYELLKIMEVYTVKKLQEYKPDAE